MEAHAYTYDEYTSFILEGKTDEISQKRETLPNLDGVVYRKLILEMPFNGDIYKRLKEMKVNPNIPDLEGILPIIHAIKNEDSRHLREVLINGANVFQAESRETLPYTLALEYSDVNKEAVKYITVLKGDYVSMRKRIAYLVEKGRMEEANNLISLLPDEEYETLVDDTIQQENVEVLEVLLEYIANVIENCVECGRTLTTFITKAMEFGSDKSLETILDLLVEMEMEIDEFKLLSSAIEKQTIPIFPYLYKRMSSNPDSQDIHRYADYISISKTQAPYSLEFVEFLHRLGFPFQLEDALELYENPKNNDKRVSEFVLKSSPELQEYMKKSEETSESESKKVVRNVRGRMLGAVSAPILATSPIAAVGLGAFQEL
jgi:hypothetical protein